MSNIDQSAEKNKKPRHRKKCKYNAIRQQMEFYFGDANLSKDRYLGQCIKNDPYIPLSEFLKFNRIKALTDSVEEITKSLKESNFLQVSDDNTRVRRTTEVGERKNLEECTIYVESLPQKADHEWVTKVFSTYGKVAYVSLPKYKNSKKIKEFGFVEYEQEASVQKALNAFQAFGCVLSFESVEPEKLMSITTFIKEKEEGNVKIDAKEVENINISNEAVEENQKDGGGDSEGPPTKRQKVDEPESGKESEMEDYSTATEGEDEKSDGEKDENENEDEADKDKNKKKRKRKKRSCGIKKEIQQDEKVYELKIMSKKDWKKLRNKYLNMQRTTAKRIKTMFAATNKNSNKLQAKPSNLNKKTIQSSPRNINFYGANPDGNADVPSEVEENKALIKKPLFSFEPGLIVNIKFREPCVDVKDFKAELRQHSYVKYIDLKEGAMECFVRVDKASSANMLVKEYSMAEYMAQILSGETEKEYWDRINKDREDKLNKTVKVQKVRGRTKLMKKINTHIVFDDD